MAENGNLSSREQVLEELRGAEKLIVVTHENLDGDALGQRGFTKIPASHALPPRRPL